VSKTVIVDANASSPVLTRIGLSVAVITLQRPDLANALEPKDVAKILDYLDILERDPAIRCLILTGAGAVFSSGFNLQVLAEVAGDGWVEFARMVDRIECSRLFTLAALNGPAVGGAADLALACDMRIGVPDLHIHVPAARIGLPLYGGALRRFVARLGLSHALSILLSCQKLFAQTLLHAGYLQRIERHDDLLEFAENLAGEIASFPAAPLSAMKEALLSLGNELSHAQRAKLAAGIDAQAIGARIRGLSKGR
jgi:enoyl-CoA hydratase/carnithine racemase